MMGNPFASPVQDHRTERRPPRLPAYAIAVPAVAVLMLLFAALSNAVVIKAIIWKTNGTQLGTWDLAALKAARFFSDYWFVIPIPAVVILSTLIHLVRYGFGRGRSHQTH